MAIFIAWARTSLRFVPGSWEQTRVDLGERPRYEVEVTGHATCWALEPDGDDLALACEYADTCVSEGRGEVLGAAVLTVPDDASLADARAWIARDEDLPSNWTLEHRTWPMKGSDDDTD